MRRLFPDEAVLIIEENYPEQGEMAKGVRRDDDVEQIGVFRGNGDDHERSMNKSGTEKR